MAKKAMSVKKSLAVFVPCISAVAAVMLALVIAASMFWQDISLWLYGRSQNTDAAVLESGAELCEDIVEEGVVLLKNEDGFLPLSKEQAGELALIGPLGDAWYQDWYGGEPPFRTTLLDGIKELTGAGIACADGLDRVVFRCGEQGIAVAEDGTLCLRDEPDVFIREDWGSGSHTFRCVRTGKYMNSRLYGGPDSKEEPGRIAAENACKNAGIAVE